jgi:hypothetical protein
MNRPDYLYACLFPKDYLFPCGRFAVRKINPKDYPFVCAGEVRQYE